jgi:predicted nucleotidyltransferase
MYFSVMRRSEAITRLQHHAEAVKALGATSLYLFGSAARDEAQPDSDLDLFIDYDPGGRFNAFDLVGIKQYLENALGTEVDVTTRDGLHPMLRAGIERSAIRVF